MDLIADLQARLDKRANPKTKAWWESYLKHVIPFRGVKMADIRSALHAWVKAEKIASEPMLAAQKDLALRLFQEPYAEDKLAGILFLQEVLLPTQGIDCHTDLPWLARLFKDRHINDWNTCDWFCVKVLGPLVEQQGPDCARAIAQWKDSGNLWQRRAAGVAFVNLAKNGEGNFPGFTALVLEICADTVRHPERFGQTGTGWVLRELSLADPESVVEFVERYLHHFSSEGLRYATEKMPTQVKKRLTQLHRKRR